MSCEEKQVPGPAPTTTSQEVSILRDPFSNVCRTSPQNHQPAPIRSRNVTPILSWQRGIPDLDSANSPGDLGGRPRMVVNTPRYRQRSAVSEDDTATVDNHTTIKHDIYLEEMKKVYSYTNQLYRKAAYRFCHLVVRWAHGMILGLNRVSKDLYGIHCFPNDLATSLHQFWADFLCSAVQADFGLFTGKTDLHLAFSNSHIHDLARILLRFEECFDRWRLLTGQQDIALRRGVPLCGYLMIISGYCVGDGLHLEDPQVRSPNTGSLYHGVADIYGETYYSDLTQSFGTICRISSGRDFLWLGRRVIQSPLSNNPVINSWWATSMMKDLAGCTWIRFNDVLIPAWLWKRPWKDDGRVPLGELESLNTPPRT